MKKFSSNVMELMDSVVFALIAVMLAFTLVCRIYVVDGEDVVDVWPVVSRGKSQ